MAAALRSATFESEPRHDIMRWKYGKLLMNLANAVEGVCGPDTRTSELAAIVLARKAWTRLLPPSIAFVGFDEDSRRRGDLLRLRPISGRRREGGSTWQSLRRGTGAVESDYLNGEIVLLGRLHGVPTPANELLRTLAHNAARDGIAPGAHPVEDVLAQLQ